MTPVTALQWRAYELTHPDHQDKSYEEAAEKMGVTEDVVGALLSYLHLDHPDLFTDISSGVRRFDNGVSRYSGRLDSDVKKLF